MIQQFTTKRDVMAAFSNAMNLISPEVENHHEKVAYIAGQIAKIMGLNAGQRQLVIYGALLHDIGGVLKRGNVSLTDLEMNARETARSGAAILRSFPVTLPLSQIVAESQTPWEVLRSLKADWKVPQQIGHIIHLADAVTLLLDGNRPVLNQVRHVKECILREGKNEFSPNVMDAFETLCSREHVWLDILYRPKLFLEMDIDNRDISLAEMVKLTEFMSRVVDFRSPFTAMHSAGVAATAQALAQKADMSEDECRQMRIAGYLHDIGKLKIPNEILEKPGKLTDEEFNIMKEHAYYTWMILKDVKGFGQITVWAAYHHEKLNGYGYPFHLPKDELPLGSRIMAVADIFSALTEDRPYRKRMDKEKVADILRGDAEKGLISSGVVDLLMSNYDEINKLRASESRAASRKYQESLKQAET